MGKLMASALSQAHWIRRDWNWWGLVRVFERNQNDSSFVEWEPKINLSLFLLLTLDQFPHQTASRCAGSHAPLDIRKNIFKPGKSMFACFYYACVTGGLCLMQDFQHFRLKNCPNGIFDKRGLLNQMPLLQATHTLRWALKRKTHARKCIWIQMFPERKLFRHH